jgi:membrane-associated protease RseP (regulator of RpoE activity)
VQEEAAQNSAWGSSNSTDGPPQIWDRFNEPELDILEYQKFDGDRRHIPSFGHNTQFNVGRQWGARIHSEAVLHADTTAVNFCVGITVQNSGDRRVLVTNVEPDSEAAFRGLRAGDLIFSVENVPIRTIAQLRDVMIHDPSNPLVFGVERDGRITNIPINNSPCVS